jgi:hypothetical protein
MVENVEYFGIYTNTTKKPFRMNNYTIIALLIGVVGYFLRDLHTRLKQTEKDIIKGHDDIIKNKAKMEAIESFQVVGFTHIEKLFEEKFKRFDEKFIGLDASLTHINNNVKSSHDLFAIIIQDKNK